MKLALFDLDGTLLEGDSDHAFGEYLVQLGWADADEYRRRNDEFYVQYQAGRLDIHAYIDFATAPWRDRDAQSLRAASDAFTARIAKSLHPEAMRLVRRHLDAGDLAAIVTATNDFITRPIAHLFGVEHLVATDLQRDAEGRVTGAIAGTPAFRDGKIARVSGWLAGLGLAWHDFESSHFYSDSTNDLPLLETVSHPVATNPSTALAHIALARAWPVLRLFEPRLNDQEIHSSTAGQD